MKKINADVIKVGKKINSLQGLLITILIPIIGYIAIALTIILNTEV